MEISEKVAKLNISFNILRGGEQQDKLIRNLAQRVEDFIIECVKFTTTVAKRVPGRVDNLPITQRRRIKPTLISNFGLIGRMDSELVMTKTQNPQTSQNPQNHAKSISHDLSKRDVRIKLHEGWEQVESLLLTPEEEEEGEEGGVSPSLMGWWHSMNGMIALARCMRACQTLLESDMEIGLPILRDSSKLLRELGWFSSILKRNAEIIFRLAPSQIEVLEGNHLFRIVGVEGVGGILKDPIKAIDWARRSSILPPSDSDSDLDAVPLAYNDRRDSRNYADHQLLHANQQKLRDLLLDWIRRCWLPSQRVDAQRAALDIIRLVMIDNFGWFAEVLVKEFEQLERARVVKGGRDRLQRLEERLTGGIVGENAVLLFISFVDSFRLTTALQIVLFETIDSLMRPIIDGTNREEPRFSNDLIRLASLGRMLGGCTGRIVGRYEDPVLCFVRDSIRENPKSLLCVLPWVIVWIRECNSESVTDGLVGLLVSQRSLKDGANMVAIRLLLDSVIPADKDSILHETEINGNSRREESTTTALLFGTPLDEDLISMERTLSFVLTDFKSFITELSQVNAPFNPPIVNDAKRVTQITPIPTPTLNKPPRKVRPTSENGAAMQRKLRHWFWWQHPLLKELCDLLARYIVAEGMDIDEAAKLLWLVIPPLLPKSLTLQMAELVISLVLESTRHFDLDPRQL